MSAPTDVRAPTDIDGRAPRGAWWVAFRLQRTSLLIGLGVMALMAALVLWHRTAVMDLFSTEGVPASNVCPAPNGTAQENSSACVELRRLQAALIGPWEQLRGVWLVLPTVIGAVSGAALFVREFERRTQVFALTQSAGTLRWFTTKVAVGLIPLLAASIGVGFLFELTANTYGAASWTPFEPPIFFDFGFAPAAVLLVSFALGAGISTLLRQSLGAVLVSVVAALVLLWGLVFGYQYLGPIERVTSTELSESLFAPPARSEYLGSGFLDSSGREVQISYECTAHESGSGQTEIDSVYQRCFASQGAVQKFADYLPLSARARVTWTVSGTSAALSAMFLALGYGLLRRRVA